MDIEDGLPSPMSPTVFRRGPFRFYFFSREESRMHVHVECASGEAKFWLEPLVSLAVSHGLKPTELKRIQSIVEEERNAIVKEWKKHFKA